MQITLTWMDWWQQFQHYLMLSLLSIGGAVTTLPEMHRFYVVQHHWLTETQFNASIAISQAAPGPNVLAIALLAWNVGINSGSVASAFFSVFIAMIGILLPSTTLTIWVSGWLQNNHGLNSVKAFKQGLAPIVIALLIATGWIIVSAHPIGEWRLWLLAGVSALVLWRTKIHLLWLIAVGALLGWFGLI